MAKNVLGMGRGWDAGVAIAGMALFAAAGGCSGGGPAGEAEAARRESAAAPMPPPEVSVDFPSNPTSVVCTVDGVALTQGEVDSQIKQNLAAGGPGGGIDPSVVAQMRGRMTQQIVDRFVVETLFAKEAEKQKIGIETGAVEKALGDIRQRVPEGSTLEALLAQHGRDMNQLKGDLERSLKIKKLIEGCTNDLKAVTSEEIAAFYKDQGQYFETPESVKTRHILIKCEPTEDAAAHEEKRLQAEAIRKQLVDGGDFAKLAAEHSACPSKDRGGDLGNVTRDQTVKEFEDAAFGQKVDELGPVVKTQFGYHIIQVQAHNAAAKKPLEEVTTDIAGYLANERQQKAISDYVDKLKAQAVIDYGSNDVR